MWVVEGGNVLEEEAIGHSRKRKYKVNYQASS